MRILLTNDDGIFAPGLLDTKRALAGLGEVVVVAPQVQQSGAAHAITVHGPLTCSRVHLDGEFLGHGVEGKPADCVKLGICEILDQPPDLVVSGINLGANAGIDVLYSGTVAAAVEGAFFGIPSLAVSAQHSEEMDFALAARVARWVIDAILAHGPRPGRVYNINIPVLDAGWPKGIRAVKHSVRTSRDQYERRQDPRGRDYFWLKEPEFSPEPPLDTDAGVLAAGYVAVTPLHYDLTHHDLLAETAQWDWPLPPDAPPT